MISQEFEVDKENGLIFTKEDFTRAMQKRRIAIEESNEAFRLEELNIKIGQHRTDFDEELQRLLSQNDEHQRKLNNLQKEKSKLEDIRLILQTEVNGYERETTVLKEANERNNETIANMQEDMKDLKQMVMHLTRQVSDQFIPSNISPKATLNLP